MSARSRAFPWFGPRRWYTIGEQIRESEEWAARSPIIGMPPVEPTPPWAVTYVRLLDVMFDPADPDPFPAWKP